AGQHLGRPSEGRKMSVVALADDVEVEAETVHMHLLRAGQGEPAPRRVRRVVDIERLAAAVARGHTFDLEGEDIGDHGRAPKPGKSEIDRFELDAAEIANQVFGDEGGWPARLPTDDGGKSLALRVVGAIVDHACEDPVAIGHNLAGTNDQHETQ